MILFSLALAKIEIVRRFKKRNLNFFPNVWPLNLRIYRPITIHSKMVKKGKNGHETEKLLAHLEKSFENAKSSYLSWFYL